MSLLDDVSIVVTPNGYKAGTLYGVLPTYAEGAELVTNGDFATDTDWTKGTGWTISSGLLSCDGTQTGVSQVYQFGVITLGTRYQITFTVSNYSSGTIRAGADGSWGSYYSANGTYTYDITSAGTLFIIQANSTFVGSIDNVSVKEVTSSDMDVTRATAATRVDEDGLIADVLSGVPRIDYAGCPHILSEPQRTNELTQSNQFDTTWVQSGTLTSGQDGVGGSTDAWKFENPNATSSLYQADTTSGVQTVSAYFKKNSNYGVRFFAFGSVNCSTYFDLNNGAVVSVINSTAKVEPVGADWFRCSMTFDQTTSRCDFYVTNNASTQVLGDYTIQYAQLESGSYATSYIPTSGSTVTRNQDLFTRDGIGSLINDSEGVLFVEMAALSDDLSARRISINDGSFNNIVEIGYTSTTNEIKNRVKSGGGTEANMNYTATDILDDLKIALKWKVNDFAVWVNGVEVVTETSGAAPIGLSQISFDRGDGTQLLFAKVKQLQVYDTALTDTQLAALTS